MAFIYDADSEMAIDSERSMTARRLGGNYLHMFFEITCRGERERIATIVASRDPNNKEKEKYPGILYIAISNVLGPFEIFSFDKQKSIDIIYEALTAIESYYGKDKVRQTEILFNDPRYMNKGE